MTQKHRTSFMDVPSWTCTCMLRECQVTFKISVRFSFQRFYLFQTACMFDCLFKISFVFSKAHKPLHTIQIDSFLNTYLCIWKKWSSDAVFEEKKKTMQSVQNISKKYLDTQFCLFWSFVIFMSWREPLSRLFFFSTFSACF